MSAQPSRRLTDSELQTLSNFNTAVACRAIEISFERRAKTDNTLTEAAREIRAEWLAKGLSVPY